MRPKKVILCIDPDQTALSALSLTLRVSGYRVFPAETASDALAIFATEAIDLVLSDATDVPLNGRKLVRCMKALGSHIPMIPLGTEAQIEQPHQADALLVKRTVSMAQLLERVKVMTARKRGPRKGSVRIPPPGPLRPVEEVAVA